MIEPAAQIAPTFELIRPFIETAPEVSEDKPVIEKLSGQYVAITGKTGCGKSTLMRIMLGFEKPQKGAMKSSSQRMAFSQSL